MSRAADVEADVIVIGSGIAGLTFALRMAEGARVALVTKKERAQSNTNYARGGIAAVVGDDDDPSLHVGDTLVAGAGLCHLDVVEGIVREGPARVRDLIDWGAEFQRASAGPDGLSLGREGGHSRRRIVHAGDRTGRAIESALLAASEARGLRIVEDHMAVDLVLAEEGPGGAGPRVTGVEVLDEATGRRLVVGAPLVFLATGGCGRVYRHTTNPAIATGDGVAMAYRAGAPIANMEFVQFHPTALYPTEDPAFLVSEAVRGEGAVLRRSDGMPFMDAHHALGSLAPRDVVARAIHRELLRTGDSHVMLDIGPIPPEEFEARFPGTVAGCRDRGIDPRREGIPVVPAAHYACGGVRTDAAGRTAVAGLLAAGEVACTGLHGANRLASNSLLEAVVVAHRAAAVAREALEAEGRWQAGGALAWPGDGSERGPASDASSGSRAAADEPRDVPDAPEARRALVAAADEARDRMWAGAGIVRSLDALQALEGWLDATLVGLPTVDRLARTEDIEARNVLETAHLVVRSALQRRESRGLHYLEGYPWRNNERHLRDTVLTGLRGAT